LDVTFTTMGLVFSAGSLFLAPVLSWVRGVSGVIIVVMAIQMVFPFLPFLNYEKRFHLTQKPQSGPRAALVGVAFGAGWTPCIGPLLASFLLLAGSGQSPVFGGLLLSTFGLGLGIPFLALSLGVEQLRPVTAWLRHHEKGLRWLGAGLMALMGALMLGGQFTALPRLMVQAGSSWSDWAAEPAHRIDAHLVATTVVGLFALGFLLGLLR
jgi:cytochrome c-type biogenesis protein